MKMKYVIFALLVTLLRAQTYTDVFTKDDNTCFQISIDSECEVGRNICNYNCDETYCYLDQANGYMKYCCKPMDKNGPNDCP